MLSTLVSAALATTLFASASVRAESHTITFANQCGYGTPTLIGSGNVVSTGEPYVSNGPFSSAIAYLQTGGCGYNGENCTLLEMTLGNPVVAGGGSSSDISLITPHAFSVWSSFAYYGGTGDCDNTGANCAYQGCPDAFYYSDETVVQVACQDDNINLLIAFCADATTMNPNAPSSPSPSPSSSYVPPPPPPSSTYVAPTSSYVAPSSSYVAPSSSVVPSSASSAAASASASASAPRCPNKKRSLRHRRDASPEPKPVPEAEFKIRSPLSHHQRNHARVVGGDSLH